MKVYSARFFIITTFHKNNYITDDLVGTKKEASLAQSELLLQRHAKNMLHSKVDTLENKLMSQKKELISLQDDAVEKLSTAGSHLEQTRQEVSSLKAKVIYISSFNDDVHAWVGKFRPLQLIFYTSFQQFCT